MNFLVELFAPAGIISPDHEEAEVVISANDIEHARLAADAIVSAEEDDCESYVEWHSTNYDTGVGMPVIHVVSVRPTEREADWDAAEILSGSPQP